MARYSMLAGKRVEVRYRAAGIRQSTVGTLVSDSGTLICIEDRFSQNGKKKTMRIEIPYEYVIRVVEVLKASEVQIPGSPPSRKKRR
jgi:hypothetical protein